MSGIQNKYINDNQQNRYDVCSTEDLESVRVSELFLIVTIVILPFPLF